MYEVIHLYGIVPYLLYISKVTNLKYLEGQRTTTAETGRTRRDGRIRSFKYDIGTNILMSWCVDHGATFLDTHNKHPPDKSIY